MLKDYVALTKPGIIRGNLIAACSGVFFASRGDVDWFLLFCVALGVSCVVASGCVFNNYVDRDIDSKMQRTKYRGFVTKIVQVPKSLIFATIVGLFGVTVLHIFANWYAVFFAVLGFFVYVCLYTLKYKRGSVHGTLIGSVSGACPPVIGYVAVSGGVDWAVMILFGMYSVWQLPHSYAIAICQYEDYKAANIPVLPVVRGLASTRRQIIAYISLFVLLSLLLAALGYTGILYLIGMSSIGLYWLYLAISGFEPGQERAWGRKLFFVSIVVVVVLSVLISVDYTDGMSQLVKLGF